MTTETRIATLEDRIAELDDEIASLREQLRRAQLDQWQGRIDDLEVQAHLGSMELNERLTPLLESLRNHWLDAKQQVSDRSSTAGDVFDIIRNGCEQAMQDLRDALGNARSTMAG